MTEGRDVLKKENEEEKKKWLTKTGTDWSGAFGENPKDYVDSKAKQQVSHQLFCLQSLNSFEVPHCESDIDKFLARFKIEIARNLSISILSSTLPTQVTQSDGLKKKIS